MFPFCPHCGGSLDQQQIPGQMLVCAQCRKQVGVVPMPTKKVVVDQAEELVRRGVAARCPQCQQLVEVRASPAGTSLAPHLANATPRKMCPGSGKPLASEAGAAKKPPAGKDLSAFMTRDRIRVISCAKTADPLIEELTLEYLDKADRVRLQIEALRELLGADFRMKAYPQLLSRADLAVWGNANDCVIARRHPQGGYQPLTDAEVAQVLEDLKQHRQLFFQTG
jgi:hypothetical protein